jgi:hypothetical protein
MGGSISDMGNDMRSDRQGTGHDIKGPSRSAHGRGSESALLVIAAVVILAAAGTACVSALCSEGGADGDSQDYNTVTTFESMKSVLNGEDDGRNVLIGGSFAITENIELRSGRVLIVPGVQSLTISKGVTLTNNGTIVNDGTITNNGTFANSGVIKGSGTIDGSADHMIVVYKGSIGGNTIDITKAKKGGVEVTTAATEAMTIADCRFLIRNSTSEVDHAVYVNPIGHSVSILNIVFDFNGNDCCPVNVDVFSDSKVTVKEIEFIECTRTNKVLFLALSNKITIGGNANVDVDCADALLWTNKQADAPEVTFEIKN